MAKLTLAAIAASCVEVEIDIAGVKLRAMPPSAAAMGHVLAAFPQPEPPMVEDLNAGSLAPKVPDHTDPRHRAASEKWTWDLRRGVLAMAIASADASQMETMCAFIEPEACKTAADEKMLGQYIQEAARMIGRCRNTEVLEAFDRVTGRESRRAVEERIEGN